jgi:hypothetical protein
MRKSLNRGVSSSKIQICSLILLVWCLLGVESSIAQTKSHKNLKSKYRHSSKKIETEKKWPEISFLTNEINFDTIKAGTVVTKKFYFTNTGYAPLQIKKTEVSCGCTIPSFPFIDILPLEQGFIEMTFKSEGKNGPQHPSVVLFTNCKNPTKTIYMKGVVE